MVISFLVGWFESVRAGVSRDWTDRMFTDVFEFSLPVARFGVDFRDDFVDEVVDDALVLSDPVFRSLFV